jgi:hypothetical protein
MTGAIITDSIKIIEQLYSDNSQSPPLQKGGIRWIFLITGAKSLSLSLSEKGEAGSTLYKSECTIIRCVCIIMSD